MNADVAKIAAKKVPNFIEFVNQNSIIPKMVNSINRKYPAIKNKYEQFITIKIKTFRTKTECLKKINMNIKYQIYCIQMKEIFSYIF